MIDWTDGADRRLAEYRDEDARCCALVAVPGAGHSHDCPNHEPASCPSCREEDAMRGQAMTFRIEDPKTGEDVLGGAVDQDNAYVAIYPDPASPEKDKHPLSLGVGESSMCWYRLSGSKGLYRVRRIE